jgi:DNA-binding SARP family transcriptional activator
VEVERRQVGYELLGNPRAVDGNSASTISARKVGTLLAALYLSERRAEVLAAYRSARRILVEELGLEPCPPMRIPHRAILRSEDPEPEPEPIAV